MNKKNILFSMYLLSSINSFTTQPYAIIAEEKNAEDFRDYENNASETVKEFYRLNHIHQTLSFVLSQKQKYAPLDKLHMGIWDAIKVLDAIVDESDPDLSLPQSVHAFQTAEKLRKDDHPRWLILVGLIHDLGKVLMLFDEPQWAVVGDTFPVGCAYSNKVIFSRYFENNPDTKNATLQTLYGIYTPNCGLNNVHMSWGHDEYLYSVVKNYLPEQALYIIKYHSFYAAHKESAYDYLMNDYDKSMMKWLKLFSNYDLYSKSSEPINSAELLPYYKELVAEYFPEVINW
jgi:inositol oxygenase